MSQLIARTPSCTFLVGRELSLAGWQHEDNISDTSNRGVSPLPGKPRVGAPKLGRAPG